MSLVLPSNIILAGPTTALPDGNEPLHDGTGVSVLTACFLLISFMSENNIPKTSMRHLWDVLTLLLGPDMSARMPPFDTALRLVSSQTGYVCDEIECCINDCVLFRNRPLVRDPAHEHQLAQATQCPKCGEARSDQGGKARRKFSWLGVNRQLAARIWFPGVYFVIVSSYIYINIFVPFCIINISLLSHYYSSRMTIIHIQMTFDTHSNDPTPSPHAQIGRKRCEFGHPDPMNSRRI